MEINHLYLRSKLIKVESVSFLHQLVFQAFWQAMVLPSITFFHKKMEWLNNAASTGWPDSCIGEKPITVIGKSPARPKENRPPKLV